MCSSDLKNTRGWNKNAIALGELGIPKGYDDYREMLAKEKLDLVVFCPENSRHGEVAEAIAAHGAHMLTEKPMAASLSEALRMSRAAEAAGVSLIVNWPITWSICSMSATMPSRNVSSEDISTPRRRRDRGVRRSCEMPARISARF